MSRWLKRKLEDALIVSSFLVVVSIVTAITSVVYGFAMQCVFWCFPNLLG